MGRNLSRLGKDIGLYQKLQNPLGKTRRDEEKGVEKRRPSSWEGQFAADRKDMEKISASRKDAIRRLPRMESGGKIVITRKCI